MLEGGTLPGVFKVVNFGSRPAEAFAKLHDHQSEGPKMCGEFWNGWFDHWGEKHHHRDPLDAAKDLEVMLAANASVNFYMFHGGTNFGFMAGANHTDTEYQPDVTSYDYGAPLNEAGDPTPKFYACRNVIAKYVTLPPLTLPSSIPRKAFGEVSMTQCAPLFSNLDHLSKPIRLVSPTPMEQLGQSYGFILYRTTVKGPREKCQLVLQEVHDRALIFVNGKYHGVIDRNMKDSPIHLEFGRGEYQLDILVENMGRINYGPLLHDRKGITQGVRLGNQFLFDWIHYPLPLENLRKLCFDTSATPSVPSFYKGSFTVKTPADTFLALTGWTKGVAWINGFNLGRYWEELGPQRTLFVPAPKLRKGRNELVILELHDPGQRVALFRDTPDLG